MSSSVKSASPSAPSGSSAPASIMPDVQGSGDLRRVAIDKVGVKNVTYPIRLLRPPSAGGGEQTTVATIDMYVSLPHEKKGTHMSRFMEVLNSYDQAFSPADIPAITRTIRDRLGAADAHFSASFTYFIKKFAPVTGQPSLMDYQASFTCAAGATDDFILGVKAPATSLCPCSKEISQYGAHNQRCLVEARVRFNGQLWIEDLVTTLEKSASMELFGVLKRPDEKFVTERAYENPKFVEDIVRDLAVALNNDSRIVWYNIASTNYESIHSHDAYAEITRDKRTAP
jgi:GTP cyclohydrolase I